MQDETRILERVTRTERAFTPRHTTYAEAFDRFKLGTRIWVDIGEQKQAIRTMWSAPHLGTIAINYTLRTADNKHATYRSADDDMLDWFEEAADEPPA